MYNEFNSIRKKNLITLTDYSLEEIKTILQLSHQFKEKGKANFHNLAAGKNVALLFDLPSLRTRSAFSLAVKEMGGGIIEYYSPNNIHNESLLDIAKVMSKIFDLIIYRAKFHESIEILAKYSEIPVINAMSPAFHPVQGLTDIVTIQTYFKNQHIATAKAVEP